MKEEKKPKNRIPYENWANSQLSIAKYYGGCRIDGKDYILDYKNCEKKIIDGQEKFFPDLVEV